MTGPRDPFAAPGDDADPPPYGIPPAAQPPAYGQPPQPQPYPQQQGTSALAIGALISAFVCSPVGIILGFVARSQIRKTGQSGDGIATAAIVVGVVSILLGIVLTGTGNFPGGTAP